MLNYKYIDRVICPTRYTSFKNNNLIIKKGIKRFNPIVKKKKRNIIIKISQYSINGSKSN